MKRFYSMDFGARGSVKCEWIVDAEENTELGRSCKATPTLSLSRKEKRSFI